MIALACPFCAQQVGSASATLLVLALLAVPFVLAALTLRAIRNLDG
jgi:hypothetical protein